MLVTFTISSLLYYLLQNYMYYQIQRPEGLIQLIYYYYYLKLIPSRIYVDLRGYWKVCRACNFIIMKYYKLLYSRPVGAIAAIISTLLRPIGFIASFNQVDNQIYCSGQFPALATLPYPNIHVPTWGCAIRRGT